MGGYVWEVLLQEFWVVFQIATLTMAMKVSSGIRPLASKNELHKRKNVGFYPSLFL